MLFLKGCSRCLGDLYQERDIYGNYIVCLQCGYYLPDFEVMKIEGLDAVRTAEKVIRASQLALAS